MKTILSAIDYNKNGRIETEYMIDADITRETYTLAELEDLCKSICKSLEKIQEVENLLKKKGGRV